MNKTVGFIGCGNMGGAIAKAVAKKNVRLLLCDKDSAKAEVLAKKIHAETANISAVAENSDIIFLGVKPQVLASAIEELKKSNLNKDAVIVSMAAGVKIERIESAFGESKKIIRIMPNIPVSVGKGMILYTANKNVTKEDKDFFLDVMSECGELDCIDEKLIDAGSALSGCGPAFVYMFIEAMADGAVACGLSREKAIKYAAETLIGSSELLKVSGKHPEELKDSVCSPAGSTIVGVNALEKGGMRGAVMSAVIDAFNKTKELGK